MPQRDRIVLSNPIDAEKVLSQFGSVFSLDIETTDLRYSKLQVEGVSLCDGRTATYIDFHGNPAPFLHYLQQLVNRAQLVIMHNATFDAKGLHKLGLPIFEPEWYDTMVAAHLLDETSEKSLKFLASKFLHVEVEAYKEASRAGSHTQKFYEYAMNDAEWTWDLALLQRPQLEEQGLTHLMRDIEMPFLKVLARTEMTGVKVDLKAVSAIRAELEKKVIDLETQMLEELGEKYELQLNPFMEIIAVKSKNLINFNSTKDLCEILFVRLGLPQTEQTESGAPSVGKEALGKLAGKHAFVDLLLQYRQAQKLLSAFFIPLPTLVDPDGRVRPHFRDTGTKTGRLSCSDPNLQQLPKALCVVCKDDKLDEKNQCKKCGRPVIVTRSCFIASPGMKMISCDYSGQEIRVLAQVSQDPTLIKTLRDGADLHLATANKFFSLGIPEEALIDGHPDHDKYKKQFKVERNKAKIINFGIAYGKGAYGFAKDFGITEEEAQKILDAYFQGFPGVKKAIEAAHKSVRDKGYVAHMAGRRRRFQKQDWGGYRSGDFRESFNFLIQGYSADMIRMASIATDKLSQEHPNWNLRMIASIHDENLYEVNSVYAEEAAAAIKKAFEGVAPPDFSVPMVAECSYGNNYGELK
jgi:DNA polymerase I